MKSEYRVRDDQAALAAAGFVLCILLSLAWAFASGEIDRAVQKFEAREAAKIRLEYGNVQR